MTITVPKTGPEEHAGSPAEAANRAWAISDALEAAIKATGAEVAELFLREPDGAGIALAGFRGPFFQAFNEITRFDEGQGYPGIVVWQGRPLSVFDVSNDERLLRKSVKDLGFRSFLCVPVPGAKRVVGSLDVASRAASGALLSRCIELTREAERLGMLLERMEEERRAPRAAEPAESPDLSRVLELRLLGTFGAWRGGTSLSIDSFARRRAVTLLKILLTNYGKTVVRDELIDLLWPAEPPKDGAQLLKIVVHYLRRGLGQAENGHGEGAYVLTEANGYCFNAQSAHRLDVLEFEARAEEGFHFERRGRWREALVALQLAADFYGGDYLQDEPYSDWCLKRRRQLREKYFDVLLTTARLHRSGGDHEAATRCYRRILDLDPCLEEVHRDLMEVLYFSGKRTQALRQYEVCRAALKDEFNVDPVMETETLYRSILAGSFH